MSDYFARLVAETPSRVWVNNPTLEEIGLALDAGAVGCTTNPSYGGGLLKRAADQVIPVVDAVLADQPDADDRAVAGEVQRRLVARIAARFHPLYEASAGSWGYVSIQGSPEDDTEGEVIWEEAQAGKAIAPNVAPKIPATAPGFVAFERVVERGWPVIVTEVFSLDQLAVACEIYEEVTARTKVRSRFFMSPITGILGDHLKKLANQQGLEIPARSLELAGVGLARRCAALVRERAYPVTLLFGGARIPEDLTGLVGERHCATINWSTFAEIRASDPPIEHSITVPFDPSIEAQLLETFPDVWKGWELGRLELEDFEGFGPVQHFRDNFLAGWRGVLAMVAERRPAAALAG
jgi:transaldolase